MSYSSPEWSRDVGPGKIQPPALLVLSKPELHPQPEQLQLQAGLQTGTSGQSTWRLGVASQSAFLPLPLLSGAF